MAARRARDDLRRQSDGRGDRPPHLQRLHEGVHLSEAGPVDIPQAETRTLKDVLELPWGFEIYGLLTRWNPLNLRAPVSAAAPASACWSSARGRRASRSRTIC